MFTGNSIACKTGHIVIHIPVLAVVAGDFDGSLPRAGDLVGFISYFTPEPESAIHGSATDTASVE